MTEFALVLFDYPNLPNLGWYLGYVLDLGSSLVCHALYQPPIVQKDLISNQKGKQSST